MAVVAAALVLFLFLAPLGHRFYIATGSATVAPAVVRHVGVPALLCSGHGGPLQTSGVIGAPLGRDLEHQPRVFCQIPTGPLSFEYRESAYTSDYPRRMHVCVWLESHPELEGFCSGGREPVVQVKASNIKGYGSPTSTEWPCSKPDPQGGLGYAVVFERSAPDDHEKRQIELRVGGYP
jgi:hypothetical protein